MPVELLPLPERSRERLLDRFGPSVLPWCDGLPARVAAAAERWRLTPLELLPAGATSVVLLCATTDGGRAVLKLVPDPGIAADEALGLRLWSGSRHVVALVDADPAAGALLLEWLPSARPLSGTTWSPGQVLPLLSALRSAPGRPDGLPTLSARLDAMFALWRRRASSLPGRLRLGDLLDTSATAAADLARTGPERLVHADLHPGNVLRTAGSASVNGDADANGDANGDKDGSGDRLVAIDPRPCRGDPAFDLVDWVLAGTSTAGQVEERIALFGATFDDVDPDRLGAWCRAVAPVLAVAALRAAPDGPRGPFLLELSRNRLTGTG